MRQLTLENIRFSYGTTPAITHIDCAFEPGKFYAILGPNGSGKTTLLDLISGYRSPEKGKICIDGVPISTFSKKDLAKKISLVTQDYTINFPFLVKDVIMMGRHPFVSRFSPPSAHDFQMVDTTMERCGITPLKDRKITELSGGEKQRCVVARALCQDTPILLLDEAFSSMDISHTLQFLNIVRKRVKEQGILAIGVFHDLNIALAWSDAALMLKKGKVKGFGPTFDLFTQAKIKEIFNVEAIVEFNEHTQSKQIYFPPV